ncbi:MAG: peptide MFS transporter [Pseudoclavibacter sp.]
MSGLITLSSVELWERFSFYGLQVILAFYLYYELVDGGLGLPTPVALSVAGSYGGLVYISQIGGAWIADRLLAPKYVVLVGAITILVGHLALAFLPGIAGLVVGLAFIVLGTGGLKVNTTMMVGALYPEGGAMRDAGYSIYYFGISAGAFLGPVITGPLQQGLGFHVAFGAAAVGMALGLVHYVIGMRRLPPSTGVIANPLPMRGRITSAIVGAALLIVIVIAVATNIVTFDNLSTVVTVIIVVAIVAYFAFLLRSKEVTAPERRNVRSYIPIFLMSLVFWTLLFQLFTSLTVYADTRVDLQVGDWSVPPSYVVTAEGLMVTIISPVLALLWSRSRAARLASSTKMVVGVVVMAAGLFVLVPFAGSSGAVNSIAMVMLVMLAFAVGEAFVAPTALSITAGLAPAKASAQMTGLYFLTMAGGSTLAGTISAHYTAAGEGMFFAIIAGSALVLIVILWLVYRRLSERNTA